MELRWLLPAALLALGTTVAAAAEPLHEVVDRHIEGAAQRFGVQQMAPLADDAEFLRRVYLDFAGRIPTADEARAFLGEASPDKRAALIDRLLQGPEYARRMREALHIMLLERRGDDEKWNAYLERSLSDNKPWNVLVREILYGEPGDDGALEGVQFFYTKRLEKYGTNPVDYDGLTRDIGRLFLGMDLQCANCHDHLFVSDYKQEWFKGLFAFTVNTVIRSEGNRVLLAENLMTGPLEFMSVFTKEPRTTGPRLPGAAEVAIPQWPKGEEYLVPPDRAKRLPGVPRFSPRKILAEQLPTASNRAFVRNSANRLWFLLLGRGLVQPLDLHHADNPPSHPELLEALADELVRSGFDLRHMLRELALSRTYQRSSAAPQAAQIPRESFLLFHEKRLSSEQLARSVLVATGNWSPEQGAETAQWKTLVDAFHKAFDNRPTEPEEEFMPSVRSALFLSNDELMVQLLEPKAGNLTSRLSPMDDDAQLAAELYLSVLSRLPTDEERAAVAEYLKRRSERRPQAIANLVWSLLASTEFCINH
jgi:hypothetical protein